MIGHIYCWKLPLSVCICISLCVYRYLNVCVCLHVCVFVCLSVCLCLHIVSLCLYVSECMHLCIVYMYKCVDTCFYVCVCTCACLCVLWKDNLFKKHKSLSLYVFPVEFTCCFIPCYSTFRFLLFSTPLQTLFTDSVFRT